MDNTLIEKLIESELKEVDAKWPDYHLHHEAYAVILEELQELKLDLGSLEFNLAEYWNRVKINRNEKLPMLKNVKRKAYDCLKESVQVYVTALRAERLIK